MSLHQLRVALGVSVLTIGCGGSPRPSTPAPQPPAPRDPSPRTGGPSCKAAADRIAVVIGEHAPDQPDGDVHERAMFELRCETDRWSDEARSCLATITGDAEADGCLQLLTRSQQQMLAADRARLRADRDGHAPE
ncbi:MAG TPA: hypothetical protein VGD37_36560 [Kofleriaceae bacterium]